MDEFAVNIFLGLLWPKGKMKYIYCKTFYKYVNKYYSILYPRPGIV
jgi:hypothetical protein